MSQSERVRGELTVEFWDALRLWSLAYDKACAVIEPGERADRLLRDAEVAALRVARIAQNFASPERAAIEELRGGNGLYYVAQERAFAPGISGEWPDVIKKPKSHNGRLVKRVFPGDPNQGSSEHAGN